MPDEFTIAPSFSSEVDHAPRLLATKFGDGYEQRAEDGLNPDLEIWSLSFGHVTDTVAADLETFCKAHRVVNFTWTPPRSAVQRRFTVKGWKRTFDNPNVNTLTATFTEVADP